MTIQSAIENLKYDFLGYLMAAKIGVKGAATKVKTHIFGNDNNKYNKNTKIIDVANLALKHPTAAN